MKHGRRVWLAAGVVVVLACAALAFGFLRESEPTVTGVVRLGKERLTNGSIAWIPIEGTPGPGGGGGIDSQGNYEIKQGLRPGSYRVEIRSTTTLTRKVKNPTIPADLVDEEVSVIPEKYNTESNLVREVKPGANVLDFNLEPAAER